jgi:hypothetical protein
MSATIHQLRRLAETRRDRRYRFPVLTVEIHGNLYQTADWSLGGLSLRAYNGAGAIGMRLTGVIRVPGTKGAAAFEGRVVRFDRSRYRLALRFADITDELIVLLERALMRRLASG